MSRYLRTSKRIFQSLNSLLAVIMYSCASEAGAYSYQFLVDVPFDPVFTDTVVPGEFVFNLDMTDPPSSLIGFTAQVDGSLDFNNGSVLPISLSASTPMGTVIATKIPFTNIYSVPGTYPIDLQLAVHQLLVCTHGPCGEATAHHAADHVREIVVQKSPTSIAQHLAQAKDAELSGNTLDLFSSLSSGGDILDAVSNFVSLAAEDQGTLWGTVISVGLGTVVAGLIGGPLGLLVGTALAFTGAFYEVSEVLHKKLAADPPDSNYQEVYQYSNATFNGDIGLGPDVNAYFQQGFVSLLRVIENKQGELTSMERAQGALMAGDYEAFKNQAAALKSFRQQYLVEAKNAGQWIGSLPNFINSHQAEGLPPDIELLFSTYMETAKQLGAPPAVAVPEPGTSWLLLMGVLGIVAAFRSHFETPPSVSGAVPLAPSLAT